MDKVAQYQHYIQEVIKQHSQHPPMYGVVELQRIFDTENNHYQLVHAGWNDIRRQYGCLIHMDIKEDGRIWIQHDGTEVGVANELVEMGVPNEDIVLAYRAPYKRPYTGFATGEEYEAILKQRRDAVYA